MNAVSVLEHPGASTQVGDGVASDRDAVYANLNSQSPKRERDAVRRITSYLRSLAKKTGGRIPYSTAVSAVTSRYNLTTDEAHTVLLSAKALGLLDVTINEPTIVFEARRDSRQT